MLNILKNLRTRFSATRIIQIQQGKYYEITKDFRFSTL